MFSSTHFFIPTGTGTQNDSECQKTFDKRVINFLKKINIITIELKDYEKYKIYDGFVISLFKNGFYDSAIIFEIGDKTIVNLNDCPISELNILKKIKNKINKCDILLH